MALKIFLFLPLQVPKKSSGEFGAIDSEKISKFADYKRFEAIPSQEVLNVVTNDSREPIETNNIGDKHKRSMSLDYKQMVSTTMNRVKMYCSQQKLSVFHPHQIQIPIFINAEPYCAQHLISYSLVHDIKFFLKISSRSLVSSQIHS